MKPVLASMRLTMLAAIGVSLAIVPITIGLLSFLPQAPAPFLVAGAIAVGLLSVLLAVAGAVTIERQRRIHAGKPDLFLALNAARSESAIKTLERPS